MPLSGETMTKTTLKIFVVLCLCLSACTSMNSSHGSSAFNVGGMSSGNTNDSYCSDPDHKSTCVIGGILFAGLVAGILLDHGHNGGGSGGCGNCTPP